MCHISTFAAVFESLQHRNILVPVFEIMPNIPLEYALIIQRNWHQQLQQHYVLKNIAKQGEFNTEIIGPGLLGL